MLCSHLSSSNARPGYHILSKEHLDDGMIMCASEPYHNCMDLMSTLFVRLGWMDCPIALSVSVVGWGCQHDVILVSFNSLVNDKIIEK